jgi:triosephosphate isomerase (TIM)
MNLGRRPLIAGNWKMFRGGPSGMSLAADCARLAAALDHTDVLIAPPFTLLAAVAEDCEQSRLLLAGQTMHTHVEGAFTGEISGTMLKECGATHVLLGHSERRQLFGETDASVVLKAQAAFAAGLIAIVCVGETLAERESGKTLEVVSRQLGACLDALMMGFTAQRPLVVAYEPVWAIGTGKTAGPTEAEEVHAALRAQLAAREPKLGAVSRILYGGSVKPDNAKQLLGCANVDGALIGGASLDIASFGAIAQDANAMHRSLS